jgi:hypothetical protein
MEITRTSLPSAPVPLRETPRPQPAPADASGTQAAAVPSGEASLWEVLTPEEREFFAQQTALGPMRYGPRRGAEAPLAAPLGRRLDVRG